MRTKRKRTETIEETATLLILKDKTAGEIVGRCDECHAEVMWIAFTALRLFGISTLPENGEVHISGSYVCSRSLMNRISDGENI